MHFCFYFACILVVQNMKQIIKANLIELFAVIVVVVNIFISVIPVLPLLFVLVLLSLFRTGFVGAYFLSSYALPVLLGSALYVIGVTGIATIVEIVLFFACLFLWIVKKELAFYCFKKAFSLLFLILVLFSLSSLFTNGGNYALTKILDSCLLGVFVLFAYGFFFSNPQKCDYTRVGLYLILYSFLMLLISPLLNNGAGPANVLDFGYLRTQNTMILSDEKFVVDYQHVGLFATLGCACIFLEAMKDKLNLPFLMLCVLLCTVSSLYSGARQSVVISLVLLLFAIFQHKKSFSRVFSFAFVTLLLVFLFNMLVGDEGMFNSVKEEGYMDASGRGLYLIKGVNDFLENPWFGVGFGRFDFYGDYGRYPHNMFVEILCELGIVGLLVIFIIIFKPLIQLFKSEKACLPLLLVYFLRSMTSGGLDSNIMMFSFIFATMSLSLLKKNSINIK